MAKLSSEIRSLVKAAGRGDVDRLRAALAGGLDPDTRLPGGRTALMVAARKAQPESVRLLLQAPADPNVQDDEGESALGWSVSSRYLKTGDRAIDAGGVWLIDRIFSGGNLLSGEVVGAARVDEKRAGAAALVVGDLLGAGAICRTANHAGETPLMLAAESGFLAAARALIDAGSHITAEDHEGNTALTRAAVARRWDVVHALVEADPGAAAGRAGEIALSAAMDAGRKEVAGMLLQTVSSLEPGTGQAALEWAAREGHSAITVRVLELLPGLTAPASALIAAAAGGDLAIVERIIDAGADIDARNEHGITALMAAHPRVARALISAGADVNARAATGRTPLLAAADRHDVFTLVQLIASGADVGATTEEGDSAQDLAERERYRLREAGVRDWDGYAIARILEAAAEVAALTPEDGVPGRRVGRRPLLIVAAELGNLDLTRRLIAAGADLEERGPEEETALMKAAEWGHASVLAELIAAGADVEARADLGETPLMWACTAEAVQALTAAGADPDARNDRGRTALRSLMESTPAPLAREGPGALRRIIPDHLAVIRALAAAGADLDAQDSEGWTPLIAAIERGVLSGESPPTAVVDTLIGLGARLHLTDHDGRTALMHAAERCNPQVLAVLIGAGAEVNARDEKGRTALRFARSNCGSDKPKQVLIDAGGIE